MFASVGRRLALLNAAVVALAIALVGAATFALLRQSLNREADRALAERADAAQTAWAPLFATGQPQRNPTAVATPTKGEADADGDEGDDALEGGDTLLYAFGADGQLLADPRGLSIPGLPVRDAVGAALRGTKQRRTLHIDEANVRVYTAPVVVDGRIVGAIQVARGQGEHEAELRLVQIGSLIGIGVGILIAVPAGIFLSGRAMRPIDAAFARQRTFVADASHELRTPLAVIRANAELVQRLPSATPEVREEVGNIVDEVDEMARLSDDLLLLARLDDAAVQLDLKSHDLGETVRAAAETMEDRARLAGLSVTAHTDAPVTAVFDQARIRQVLRILLDNAIAYTPSGGRIDVKTEHHGGKATVRVTDTGVGIAAEDQGRVFDRFHRADHARTRKTGGAGLGLAIARALIEAHGGQIGLESSPGRGTTVWVTLPAPPTHIAH
ncbi:MAG TPA: HAMP domain-containing sensor histidine kinase [Thermomicrobiales bacterium]|jgi:signal transduction histidine kinase